MTAILETQAGDDLPALPESPDEATVLAFTDRILRDIGDLQRERAANEAACKAEVARITNGWTDINNALERREARLTAYVETLAPQIPMRGKKSRQLSAGEIGWRQSKARIDVVDEDRVRAWVIAHCTQAERAAILEIVEEERLRKKPLTELVLSTGEVPDGAELKPAEDRFYLKVSEPHG